MNMPRRKSQALVKQFADISNKLPRCENGANIKENALTKRATTPCVQNVTYVWLHGNTTAHLRKVTPVNKDVADREPTTGWVSVYIEKVKVDEKLVTDLWHNPRLLDDKNRLRDDDVVCESTYGRQNLKYPKSMMMEFNGADLSKLSVAGKVIVRCEF